VNEHYLLDTCAWIDAFSAPELLKPHVRRLLTDQRVVHVAAISLLEVARKEARGELVFGLPLADWFRIALPQNRVKVIEASPEIVIDATRLPEWSHKDPADQFVVATARVHRLTVLTSDGKICAYPHVKSIATRK
jgi:PIN domain nuclease of toxin-antitoxin system